MYNNEVEHPQNQICILDISSHLSEPFSRFAHTTQPEIQRINLKRAADDKFKSTGSLPLYLIHSHPSACSAADCLLCAMLEAKMGRKYYHQAQAEELP